MLNVDQHTRNKERILSTIKIRGPSLPTQVARDLGVSLLFASAFLSELKDEDKLKMSNLRIGSSPLYFLSGQEAMLENFVNHLNNREREAFMLLKVEGVLEDEKLEPVVRVALRAIRDFAIPVRIRADNDAKVFWKHFSLNDVEAEDMIKTKLLGLKEVGRSEANEKKVLPTEEISESVLETKKEVSRKRKSKEASGDEVAVAEPEIVVEKKTKMKKQEESEFANSVRNYFSGKEIEVLDVLSEKKKEFEGKLRVDTMFGKQEFYFIAKDKKSVGDNDFAVALQRAQSHKVPAIVLAAGEVNKKGKEYLDQWKNLVKFERLEF